MTLYLAIIRMADGSLRAAGANEDLSDVEKAVRFMGAAELFCQILAVQFHTSPSPPLENLARSADLVVRAIHNVRDRGMELLERDRKGGVA